MLTQTADDQTSLVTGFSENEGAEIRQTNFQWIERTLFFNQLLGHHDIDGGIVVLD